MSEYALGCNIFLNINITRYKFYQSILEFSKDKREISYDQLMALGSFANMSSNYTKDEIVGCLYAKFLVPENVRSQTYHITDRAIRDFAVYSTEAIFKPSELTLTIDFRKKDIKLSFFVMDTVPMEVIPKLGEFGWSLNKSLKRLMFRCKSIDALSDVIYFLTGSFEPYLHEFNGNYGDVIKTFGRERKRFKDYSANLNHRGLFKSDTFLLYEDVYVKIKEQFKNPIDWGGEAFSKKMIEKFCGDSLIDSEDFIANAITDGMIRNVKVNQFSLTGHASIIIDSQIHKHYLNRIALIIRKDANYFYLLIGSNTKYCLSFVKLLKSEGFELNDGWYFSPALQNIKEVSDLITKVTGQFYFLNRTEEKEGS